MKDNDTSIAHGGALEGIRVLELGSMLAGPFGGTLLADFGADVVKIEGPDGDSMRQVNPDIDGTSIAWMVHSRNKRSVSCDFNAEQDKKEFMRLVGEADLLIENFKPGTLEKWNLGPNILHKINPQLVIVRVSGYGQFGSKARFPAFDRVIQGYAGWPYANGFAESAPTFVGPFIADYLGGVFAAFGGLLALVARARIGHGQVVDVAQLDTLVRLSEIDLTANSLLGLVREPLGNGHVAAAPIGAYKCRDGLFVAIHAPTQRAFEALVKAIPSLSDDRRFRTPRGRVEARARLDEVLNAWFRRHPRAAALEVLQAAGVAAGPIRRTAEVRADEDLLSRGSVAYSETLGGERIAYPGIVPLLSDTPGAVRSPAPSWPIAPIGEATFKHPRILG